MYIYLAASVFSAFERKRNLEIATYLERLGHKVFLPQQIRDEQGNRPAAHQIFSSCVRGMDMADIVVAMVDGSEVDSGVAWELGYAYARSIRIIAVRSDYRAAESGAVNIMIQESATRFVLRTDPMTVYESVLQVLGETLEEITRVDSDGNL